MATFDPNRIGPGTFELVRDSTTGNYTIKEVGFTKISPLNLPDLDTTAATTTATQTQTATDVTGDTVSQQTKMAFNMPDRGGDNQPDTTGSMLQEAKQTSDMLSNTFDSPEMTRRDEAKITSPLDIQSPTEKVFDKPNMREVAGDDVQQTKPALELEEPTVRTDPRGLSARGTIDRRQGTTEGTTEETTDDSKFLPSNIATRSDQGEMVAPGIDTTTVSDQDLEADPGTKPRTDIKPKQSALETVSTSVKSVFKNIQTPTMMLIGAVTKSRGESAGAVAHNKQYFTDRGDGRIGGNPATDLYAGMNRTSMFGNLAKAGDKRIARREKTIAKRAKAGNPVSQKFIDDTNNMKDQAKDYKQSLKEAPVTGTTKPGESGGSGPTGGKSIVCTAMYQTTGLEDWKKAMKIWYIYQKKYLTIQHQEGYHKLFKPFVKGMHKSKIIKAIGAHVAKHRTQHLKHVMFNSKPSLLGKVYNKILEPICYWVGKI
jgi:hypothetical protein